MVNFIKMKRRQTEVKFIAADKETVKQMLIEGGHGGYSYVTKKERIFSIILKGVDSSYSPEEVREDIISKSQDKQRRKTVE